MKILSLITARGGSKRLPGKNLIELGGRPLISWSIEATKGIEDICSTLVSTDDEKIAQVARNLGACVPWLRPSNLAQDDSTSSDAAIHALNWYETEFGKVDGLMLLQPTSPFRARETLLTAIEQFSDSNHKPIVGICKSSDNYVQLYKLKNGLIHPVEHNDKLNKVFGKTYKITGSIYLISPLDLRLNNTFQPKNSIGLLIRSSKESIDIDTEADLLEAKDYLSK